MILVDADSYLLELSRYVVLEPVRADMVKYPGEWPWSSSNATIGNARVNMAGNRWFVGAIFEKAYK